MAREALMRPLIIAVATAEEVSQALIDEAVHAAGLNMPASRREKLADAVRDAARLSSGGEQ